MPRAPLAFVAFIGYLASGRAHADEFSWELSGLVSESDAGPALETDFSALQATHFFDPVDDANGPYALALFFDPATRVSLAFSHEKRTADANFVGPSPIVLPDIVTKTDDYSVGGRYVFPGSKWYFGGSYTKSDIEDPGSLAQPDIDASGYGLLVGKYLGSATTLEVTFNTSERESEFPIVACLLLQPCTTLATGTSEERRDHASVNVFHVRRFRSMTYSLSGRIAESSGRVAIDTPSFTLPPPSNFPVPATTLDVSIPRLKSYSVGGELFPTVKLGVRIGYSRWDDDTPAGDAYDVATTWFVRRDIGLQFVFSRHTIDDAAAVIFTDEDFQHADTATVRVIGRF
jgi:hypothetical protein